MRNRVRRPAICAPDDGRTEWFAGPVAIVVVLLTLLAAAGCGRKGDPLPPLREPDPIAETAPGEAAAADSESSESEAADGENGDDDGETGSDGEPNDDGDDDGTPP